MAGGKPKVRGGSTRSDVAHTELILTYSGDILASSNLVRFPLQPGDSFTFPWLSAQARGWEYYRFRKLKFHYVGRCASTTAGSIIGGPDYDAADDDPAHETVLATYTGALEDSVWKEVVWTLNPKLMGGNDPQGRHFVRTKGLPPGEDIRLYDCGNMFFNLTGLSAQTTVGKIWVEYHVDFFDATSDPYGGPMYGGGTAGWQVYADPTETKGFKADFTQPPTFTNVGKITNTYNSSTGDSLFTFSRDTTLLPGQAYSFTITSSLSAGQAGQTYFTFGAANGFDLQTELYMPNTPNSTATNFGLFGVLVVTERSNSTAPYSFVITHPTVAFVGVFEHAMSVTLFDPQAYFGPFTPYTPSVLPFTRPRFRIKHEEKKEEITEEDYVAPEPKPPIGLRGSKR